MVTIDIPAHSDDEFDVVNDVDAVSISDLSDGFLEAHESSTPSNTAGSERLAGPHEVPQIPQTHAQDPAVTNVTQQLSEQSIEDFSREPGSAKGDQRGNLVNDGLNYTKSMYNKLMNKDALIAVMGYVFETPFQHRNHSLTVG